MRPHTLWVKRDEGESRRPPPNSKVKNKLLKKTKEIDSPS